MRASQQRSHANLYGSDVSSKAPTATASGSMLVPLMCLTGSICFALSRPEWAALFFVLAAMAFSAVLYEERRSPANPESTPALEEIRLAPFVLVSGIFFTVVGFASGTALLALFG